MPVKRLFGAKLFNIKLMTIQSPIFLTDNADWTETMNVFDSVYFCYKTSLNRGSFTLTDMGV
jgi:hypothetical protein